VVGIADFEVTFPLSRVNVQQMHEASGLPLEDILEVSPCKEFPVLGEDEQAWELAAAAAAAVLERTGVDPDSISQVIYGGSGRWDNPIWSPAGRVAKKLGITRAHCFEVLNFCNSSMTVLQLACDRLASSGADHALALFGDRASSLVDYTDARLQALFNVGDAGAAVLLSTRDYTFKHLHSAMRTDPSWADFMMGEFRQGGIRFRPGEPQEGLVFAYIENLLSLVADTLAALGRKREDIGYFLINQGDQEVHQRLMSMLDLPDSKSVFNYERLGHMGNADPFLCLRDLLTGQQLDAGDLILVATSGTGFTWGVTALEYQG
jgi:3-oxoacyl-[acyl-carrier-protein] synthase III